MTGGIVALLLSEKVFLSNKSHPAGLGDLSEDVASARSAVLDREELGLSGLCSSTSALRLASPLIIIIIIITLMIILIIITMIIIVIKQHIRKRKRITIPYQ